MSKLVVGVNDLATVNPRIAGQADGWNPETVTTHSGKRLPWLSADCGHRWMSRVSDRANGDGCAVCNGRQIQIGVNDLATINPTLASEADGWDPMTVTAHSGKDMPWKCFAHGHRWVAKVSTRQRGSVCAVCSGRRVLAGFNDLVTINPTLASEADGWDPTTVTVHSGKKLPWKCAKHGHKWKTTVASRSYGTGCPVCSGAIVLRGFNDLATLNPDLAAEADGWDPTKISAGSDKKLPWKCAKYGHTWCASVNNRSGGAGCSVCNGKTVLAGFNDLATLNPDLASEADGWDPTTVTSSANRRMPWKCAKYGHSWYATVNRRNRGTGCSVCNGKTVLAGFNDLATLNPDLAAEADGWDPTTVASSANVSRKWKCPKCRFLWSATVNNRSRGSGCSPCAKYGYDPSKPGYLYLIQHVPRGLLKIGISNSINKRLAVHRSSGWKVIDCEGPFNGDLIRMTESAIKKMVREVAETALIAGFSHFDGITESWVTESLPLFTIRELCSTAQFRYVFAEAS
jgi:hypothetical protein